MRQRALTLLAVAVCALAFVAALPHLRFATEITEFLPDGGADRQARLAAILAQSQTARVMVLDLSLADERERDDGALVRAAQALVAHLRARPDVAWAHSGLDEGQAEDLLAFLTAAPPTAFLSRRALTEEGLRERLTELEDQLAGPLAVVRRQSAARDPLGGAWEPIEELAAARTGTLVDEAGVLLAADRRHAFVLVETRASPFQSDAQRAFRAALETWRASSPVPLRLSTAGAAQFAIASEASMKADIGRIGAISTVGLVVVFLLLFGSLRLLVLGMVPMLLGSAVALLACQAIYGEVHGITVAFGTSLLGVGLDYVEHYYTHFALAPEQPAQVTMRRVAPSLVLGALTTIIGFLGLAAAGVHGLRQMALFSVIAILTSIIATLWIVPPWMPASYRRPRALDALARAIHRGAERFAARPWPPMVRALVVAAGLGAVALAAVAGRFSDQVDMLISNHGPHVEEDRAVRARLGAEVEAFAVVTAASDEELLQAVGEASSQLAAARAAGAVASFVALDRLAPSIAEQRARWQAARAAEPRLRQALDELGFVIEELAPWWRELAGPEPHLLTLSELRASPLGPLLAAYLPAQQPPVALVPLSGVEPARLRALVPSAAIVIPSETITRLFAGVRVRTLVAFAVGLAAIFALLLARYRALAPAARALAPAALACLATVSVLVAAGIALNILHVMALLLVVSLGVDFGIFLVDTTSLLEESSRTMVSILTASVTTVLSFGLLGASESPGLAALGVTVTLGVAFSLLACFVLLSASGRAAPADLGS